MGGNAERNPMKGTSSVMPAVFARPSRSPRRLPLWVLVRAIECAAATVAAECPVGEGARGPAHGKRARNAATGVMGVYRENDVGSETGKSLYT